MTISLYAQPYDISATGFYFANAEEYEKKVKTLTNDYGDLVEECEIQFIDGDGIDCELANTIGINQTNFRGFLICAEDWEDWQKLNTIIAVGECGYNFDAQVDPDYHGIDIYHADSLRELAEQFVDEGLYGEIPVHLQFYIDYDAIARDLAMEYTETTIDGDRIIFRAS